MAEMKTFVLWAPTQSDPEVLERRLVVREAHLKNIGRLAAQGILKLGGPIFDPESGDPNGSVLVLEAESLAAVRAIVEEDPYWKGGVWNKEKVEIKTTDLTIVGAMQAKA